MFCHFNDSHPPPSPSFLNLKVKKTGSENIAQQLRTTLYIVWSWFESPTFQKTNKYTQETRFKKENFKLRLCLKAEVKDRNKKLIFIFCFDECLLTQDFH